MNHSLRDSHASYFTFRIPKWWHAQKLSLLENRTIWHTAQFDSAAAGSITQRNYVTLSVIMTSYFSASANRYKARVLKNANITHFDQNTESRSAVANWNYHLHPISVQINKSLIPHPMVHEYDNNSMIIIKGVINWHPCTMILPK